MASPTPDTRTARLRSAAALAAAGLWLVLRWLVDRFPLDGREHGDLGQFVGRLHPLLVHGPAALLLLVPAMELAGLGSRRPHLRKAAGWVLLVAVAAVFASAFDGWLLAWSGGYRGRDVTRHLWGGISLAAACTAAAWLRAHASRGAQAAYAVLLACSVGLMVWTADLGGAITHGDNYLTAHMPAGLRAWLGVAPAEAAAAAPAAPAAPPKSALPNSDPASPAYFAVHVSPLLGRSCVSCHRASKHKGGLRLDSYALLMKGGEDGAAVVPGNPAKSDLVRRLHLPPADDDFMPSDNEKPLTPEEIQMVERWIASGAKGS
jgi:uncharacterized membrane protein